MTGLNKHHSNYSTNVLPDARKSKKAIKKASKSRVTSNGSRNSTRHQAQGSKNVYDRIALFSHESDLDEETAAKYAQVNGSSSPPVRESFRKVSEEKKRAATDQIVNILHQKYNQIHSDRQ